MTARLCTDPEVIGCLSKHPMTSSFFVLRAIASDGIV